jgi:hypothetical protein
MPANPGEHDTVIIKKSGILNICGDFLQIDFKRTFQDGHPQLLQIFFSVLINGNNVK